MTARELKYRSTPALIPNARRAAVISARDRDAVNVSVWVDRERAARHGAVIETLEAVQHAFAPLPALAANQLEDDAAASRHAAKPAAPRTAHDGRAVEISGPIGDETPGVRPRAVGAPRKEMQDRLNSRIA